MTISSAGVNRHSSIKLNGVIHSLHQLKIWSYNHNPTLTDVNGKTPVNFHENWIRPYSHILQKAVQKIWVH